MRFPWQRDPKEVAKRREDEARLKQIRAQWPEVHEHAAESEHHIRVNNISEKVYAILGGKR